MKYAILAAALLSLSLPAFGKTHEVHTAKVISQNIGSSDRGIAAMPIGTMLVGVPISRRSDVVIVETSKARMTWAERITGRGPIVLPVNGDIQFYQDGNWMVVLDAKHKKHKFAVVHFEQLK